MAKNDENLGGGMMKIDLGGWFLGIFLFINSGGPNAREARLVAAQPPE